MAATTPCCTAVQLAASLIRSSPTRHCSPYNTAAMIGHLGTQQMAAVSLGSLVVSFATFTFGFLVFLTTPKVNNTVNVLLLLRYVCVPNGLCACTACPAEYAQPKRACINNWRESGSMPQPAHILSAALLQIAAAYAVGDSDRVSRHAAVGLWLALACGLAVTSGLVAFSDPIIAGPCLQPAF